MNKRATFGAGALVLLAVAFVALTAIFGTALRGARLDLTANHLYTIAPGTVRIVSGLPEPVNLYYYFSRDAVGRYPELGAYGLRVEDFLRELAARSGGKLRVSVVDPKPFSDDEDRAGELGLRSASLDPGGEPLYLGIAGTNSTDGHEAIPFLDPDRENFLEYDVAKLVYQLGHPKKPVVAWLSGLPMSGRFDPQTGSMGEPPLVLQQAEQLFDVKTLEPAVTQIEPDVDVLVLVHPKNLPPAAQYAIDQYALRGGRLLVFVDPLAEQDPAGRGEPDNPLAAMGADRSSSLGPFAAAWGITFDAGQVVGDLQYALSVTPQPGAPPVRHLGILGLTGDAFAKDDVVTAKLSSVNVATAGHVEPAKGAATHFEPLLKSSSDAALIPVSRFAMLFDPQSLLDGFKPGGKPFTLAARVTGNVKSAFPGGPPAGVTLKAGEKPLTASSKPLNLIVFADTDLLADYLWVRQQSLFGQRIAQAWAGNGDLVWNALDNLAGSADLISVRGRASFTRPFERVEALRGQAEMRFRDKEQELERELRATEDRLTELQSAKGGQAGLILSPDQERELARFQDERLRIRKELRDVRAQLDSDIERLGNWLKFVNIAGAPIVFAVVALLVSAWRRRRRARAVTVAGAAPAPAAASDAP